MFLFPNDGFLASGGRTLFPTLIVDDEEQAVDDEDDEEAEWLHGSDNPFGFEFVDVVCVGGVVVIERAVALLSLLVFSSSSILGSALILI
jgi:hypothetical protein